MDSILKSFSIGFLLRNVFAGMFFVLSYRIAAKGFVPLSKEESGDLLSVGMPIGLFVGVAVYGLHRSLTYPLIENFMNSATAVRWRKNFPLISHLTMSHLVQHWDRGAESGKVPQERAKHISAWGDYSQLQYASALCIGLGAAARVWTSPGAYQAFWPLIGLAMLLFAAGAVADWRLHALQEQVEQSDFVKRFCKAP